MGVFNKVYYCEGFRYVHEVHFETKPDDTLVRQLINRYFGGFNSLACYSTAEDEVGAHFFTWRFELRGHPDSSRHQKRWIEAILDRDTHCGARREPYYFIVLNEDGDDAITLAIAEGLARFVAREMNGKLVSKNT